MSLSALMSARVRRDVARARSRGSGSPPAEPPHPTTSGPSPGPDSGLVDQVTRHIPTEIITVYVAVSGWQLQTKMGNAVQWKTFWAFLAITPVVAWILLAIKCRESRLPVPWNPLRWPLWRFTAATLAFSVWAVVLPSGPATAWWTALPGLPGVVLIVFTAAMGLLGKLFDPIPKE